jgi:hypothetical protein
VVYQRDSFILGRGAVVNAVRDEAIHRPLSPTAGTPEHQPDIHLMFSGNQRLLLLCFEMLLLLACKSTGVLIHLMLAYRGES